MDTLSTPFFSKSWADLLPWILPVVVAILVSRFVVYPIAGSPLSRIPNAHWSAPFSSLWILHVRYKDVETEVLAEAHKKLGPIVRLGPNDVSIDGIENIKTVYTGPFDRTKWYSIFDNYGWVPSPFMLLDMTFWPNLAASRACSRSSRSRSMPCGNA